MNHNRIIRHATGRAFLFMLLVAVMALPANPALAKNGNPGIAPPESNPYGQTYNQWAAAWWQYVIGFPAATSPLNDPTGANCGDGQSGPVFFLVGTSGGSAVRDDCVVPVGKSIFFPVMNFFCAAPEDGPTAQDIVALCTWATDLIDDVQATVDGVPLQNLMAEYRFPSPIFAFDGAVDNPFDTACWNAPYCYEGVHDTGFSDGYWVMLRPLPPGEHEIHFYGLLEDWGFEVDVTYNITVANPAP